MRQIGAEARLAPQIEATYRLRYCQGGFTVGDIRIQVCQICLFAAFSQGKGKEGFPKTIARTIVAGLGATDQLPFLSLAQPVLHHPHAANRFRNREAAGLTATQLSIPSASGKCFSLVCFSIASPGGAPKRTMKAMQQCSKTRTAITGTIFSADHLRAVIMGSLDAPCVWPARRVSDPAGQLYRVVRPRAAWSR